MATFESRPGQLAGVWVSQDDNVIHISNQMVQIWKHCEFPKGHIYNCRPYIDRMESKPQRYVLVIRTVHDRAKTIDWSKAEWVVNVVGKPQLKIRGVQIDENIILGGHACWDIMFYVDVLDVVKPEGKRAESIILDEDAIMPFSVKEEQEHKLKLAFNSAYGYKKTVGDRMTDILNLSWHKSNPEFEYIGGNTMNKNDIIKAIRDSSCTVYQINTIYGLLMRNGMLNNRPLPKKVIYNGPATIVIFEDGSKTVVKLQEGETMDREKAVYAAICKRMLGSNRNRSNWLDILKPLMKSADDEWRVKIEKDALNNDIKKYSCKMEFDGYEDAAVFINLIGVLRDKNLKKEKEVVDILGYPSLTAFRKAVKAAKEAIKDGKEG